MPIDHAVLELPLHNLTDIRGHVVSQVVETQLELVA